MSTFINTTQLKDCAIPICSIREQQTIVTEVDRRISVLNEMVKEVDANIVCADRLRQSILSNAFSGQLIVPKALGEVKLWRK